MFACWFYAFVRRKFHHLCALLRPRSTTPLCHLAYQCPVGSGGGREGTQTIYVCWNNRIHFELNVLSGLQVLNYNWMAYSVPKAGLGESRNWWNVENVLLFSITWLNADKRQVNSVTWTVFFSTDWREEKSQSDCEEYAEHWTLQSFLLNKNHPLPGWLVITSTKCRPHPNSAVQWSRHGLWRMGRICKTRKR